jgi:hypothetical protein
MARGASPKSAREVRGAPGIAGELEDHEARVRTVDGIDVAAVIDLDVVGLDRDLAAVRAVDLDAPRLGLCVDRGNEVRDLARMVRVTDVDRAHAGVEVSEKQDPLVVDRRHVLVRRMGAEASSA